MPGARDAGAAHLGGAFEAPPDAVQLGRDARGVHLALVPVAGLGLEEQHRVGRRDRLLDHVEAVLRRGRGDDAQAGRVGEQRLGAFGVVLDRADAAREGHADDDGHGDLP